MTSERSLLVATLNEGKLRELRDLLADLPLTLLGLDNFPTVQPVPETGATFAENASLKAAGYARQTNMLTIADDSGLEVDALDGSPGVFSARYAGDDASDAARTAKLLAELSSIEGERRSARFVSVIAIADKKRFDSESIEGNLRRSDLFRSPRQLRIRLRSSFPPSRL